MRRRAKGPAFAVAVSAALASGGCATLFSGELRPFGGTRWHIEDRLEGGILSLIDLPFCLALDTALLPLTAVVELLDAERERPTAAGTAEAVIDGCYVVDDPADPRQPGLDVLWTSSVPSRDERVMGLRVTNGATPVWGLEAELRVRPTGAVEPSWSARVVLGDLAPARTTLVELPAPVWLEGFPAGAELELRDWLDRPFVPGDRGAWSRASRAPAVPQREWREWPATRAPALAAPRALTPQRTPLGAWGFDSGNLPSRERSRAEGPGAGAASDGQPRGGEQAAADAQPDGAPPSPVAGDGGAPGAPRGP